METSTCVRAGCDRRLLSHYRWTRMDAEQRKTARRDGWAAHYGRGMCMNCYQLARYQGTRDSSPRTRLDGGYTSEELVSEWERIYDRNLSTRQNCLRYAGRLGFKPATLERRLGRIGWQPLAARNRLGLAA